MQGEYKGYLHHERLDKYQPMTFNLITYQQTDAETASQTLRMSGTASLIFGDFTSRESIAYRFNETSFDLIAPQIVFERMAEDTDVMLQITSMRGGEIKGILYSILFGRVGSFVLSKIATPTLPATVSVIGKISGIYSSPNWRLTLNVSRESTPINTSNPFFPLNLRGHAIIPGITANIALTGGSFDFYTGRMAFKLDSGGIFFGSRFDNDTLLLKSPIVRSLAPMSPHSLVTYRLLTP